MTGPGAAHLPWLVAPWAQMQARHASGRLSQAILLGGPRGLGKDLLARRIAAFLLCEAEPASRPCGACRACGQLAAGTHPDALLMSTEGLHCLAGPDPGRQAEAIPVWTPDRESKKQAIGVDGIRKLIERLGMSAHYGKAKVAVLSPADALNGSGANMLLKTVEEPPAHTHLILVAERWRALPATLRSRCQLWRLPAPRVDEALPWLERQVPGQDSATLRRHARAPLLAAAALEPDTVDRRRQWVMALAERQEPQFPGLKREEARFGLECWLDATSAWLRQVLVPREGGPRIPPGLDAPRLSDLQDLIRAGLRGLERNGNPALIMESIIIRSAGQPAKGNSWLDPAAHNLES